MEFEEIVVYAMENKADTWFPLLCDNSAYIISSVIASKRNRFRDTGFILEGKALIDEDTGEVIQDKSYLFSHKKEENEQAWSACLFFFNLARCKSRNKKNMMLWCTQDSWMRWNDSLIAILI